MKKIIVRFGSRKIDVMELLSLFSLLLLSCPLCKYLLPTVWIAIILAVAIVSLVLTVLQHKKSNLKVLFPLFLFCSSFIVFFLCDQTSKIMVTIMSVGIPSSIVCMVYLFAYSIIGLNLLDTTNSDKAVFHILLVTIVINAIFTLRGISQDPNVSKTLATSNASAYTNVSLVGVVGYEHVYGYSFLLPMIILSFFKCKSNRILIKSALFCVSCILLLLIYKCGYFISVINIGMSFLLYFVLKRNNVVLIVILSICIALTFVLLISTGFISDALYSIGDMLSVPMLAQRIREIADYLRSGTMGVTLSRLDLYKKSIESFLHSPIIGNAFKNGVYESSGHSTLLDILALGGIVLGAFFWGYLFSAYKNAVRYVYDTDYLAMLRAVFISLIAFSFINTVQYSPFLLFVPFFLDPILMRYMCSIN